MHALLPLGPAQPRGLAVALDAHHLLRQRQRRVDDRRKGVHQLRPLPVEDPQRTAANRAEGPLRLEFLFLWSAAVGDGVVASVWLVRREGDGWGVGVEGGFSGCCFGGAGMMDGGGRGWRVDEDRVGGWGWWGKNRGRWKGEVSKE